MSQNTEIGNEVTDKVRIPGLAYRFEAPQRTATIKTVAIKPPDLKRLAQRTKAEIADVLVEQVMFARSGAVGFDWVIGEPQIELRYVDGLHQRKPSNEDEVKALIELVKTVLKARRNPSTISWDYSKPYVEISYTVEGSVY